MRLSCKFNNLSVDDILRAHGLDEGGRVQRVIDKCVFDYSIPYWAYDTGELAHSADGCIGTGLLVYDKSYARDMYYGVREDGSTFNYHTDKNPMAGAYPFERMKADRLNDIVSAAQKEANRR